MALMIVFSSFIASASYLDMKVGIESDEGSETAISNGKTYGYFINPGENNVKFIVTLENKLTDADIENISVSFILYNLTGDKNIQENLSAFDIAYRKDKEKNFEIDIPDKAEEVKKEIKITASGIDENGTVQSAEWHGFIRIEDEKHNLEISNKYTNQTDVTCGDEVLLRVWIENTGDFDESQVVLRVENEELGVDEIYSGVSVDEDEKKQVIAKININKVPAPGKYNLLLKAYYKNNILDYVSEMELNAKKCLEEQVEPEEEPDNAPQELTNATTGNINDNEDNIPEPADKETSIMLKAILIATIAIILIVIVALLLANLNKE